MALVAYEKPEILGRIPRSSHAVIEASAGTGKTHAIEHLVIELLLSTDITIEQILVLTYTERAAGELKSRVRGMIEKILSCTTARADIKGTHWLIGDEQRLKLEQSLFSFDKAPIHTIHGFFQRVILENSFSSGRLFVQSLVDGRAVFREIFMEALRCEFARHPALSGYLTCWLEVKALSIEALEKLLYECHASKRDILPILDVPSMEFALKALEAISVDEAIIEDVKAGCKIKKVHWKRAEAICNRLLELRETIGRLKDYPDLPTKLAELDSSGIAYLHVHAVDLGCTSKRAEQLLSAISRLRAVLVPFKAAVVQMLLPAVRNRLREHKRLRGYYDYDDMIAYLYEALEGSQGAALLNTLRARYRYALIDESQDTDELQWKIFRKVFHESGGNNLVFLIGDPKQAIYGFRGADVYTYLDAKNTICHASSPVSLSYNFRSTESLIEAYNEIFRQDAPRPFFNGSIRYEAPVKCGVKSLKAVNPRGEDIAPVVLFKMIPEGEKLKAPEYRYSLGNGIAAEIRSLLGPEGIRFGTDGDLRHLTAGDIFILTRKESEGRAVSEYLRDAGIPFAFYKQDGLFQTREAEHVRDLLMAVEDPFNQSRRLKAWMTPFFAVPLERLLACRDLPETEYLVKLLLDWHDLANRRRYRSLFSSIVNDSGLIKRELFFKDSERELTNYLHIFEMLLEESNSSVRELRELNVILAAYTAGTQSPAKQDGNVQRLETDKDAVQIMTMHKSKGLEAAAVFLYGGYTKGVASEFLSYHDKGRRVLYLGADDEALKQVARNECLEEDQRLLYVAVTRAKARLYLPLVVTEKFDRDAAYLQMNDRLMTMLPAIGSAGIGRLFEVQDIGSPGSHEMTIEGGADAGVNFWNPDQSLLVTPDETAVFAELRSRHAGFEVTSYTRIKQLRGERIAQLESDDTAERQDLGATNEWNQLRLPAGAAFGSAVHDVMERIPFATLQGVSSVAAWQGREGIRELFEVVLASYAVEPAHIDYTEKLVHSALTAPVPLGEGFILPGFCTLERFQREVEFLYPYPENEHTRLSELPTGEFTIGRGYVKGFIDFVFEHQGLAYFADWKTDFLSVYTLDSIKEHFEANYVIQAKLYSLALVKMLRVRSSAELEQRFGGLLYCFVRGASDATAPEQWAYFMRPSWKEVLQYEQELLQGGQHLGGEA